MGNKNSNNGNIKIIIYLDKVCYFPGEKMKGKIKIIPKLGLFEECKKHCEIIIMISQISQYEYKYGDGTETESETIQLGALRIRFSDYIQIGKENEINIPINLILPKTATPSIFLNNGTDYVMHFISVEYPHFKVKRTNIIIVKNDLNFYSRNRNLLSPLKLSRIFNKKNFLKKKGSCQLIVDMPKNYFLYNEKIVYNIHLDCRTLEIPVNKISVTFCRALRKNKEFNHLDSRIERTYELFGKDYNFNKIQKLFNVIDYMHFSDCSVQNITCISPTETYIKLDNHGLNEANGGSTLSLYPSCSLGLIKIDYYLQIKIHFDVVLTTNEAVYIPIYFSDSLDNIIPKPIINNVNNKIDKKNEMPIPNNSQSTMTNNNTNMNNIKSINDPDDINSVNANEDIEPQPGIDMNIDGKKNNLDDKLNDK